MDKSQDESEKEFAESKGSSAVAQDVTSRLLEIDRMLHIYDSHSNAFNSTLIRSISNCDVLEQCQLKMLSHFDRLLPSIGRLETKMAAFRWNIAQMEDRVASIDRRRPTTKRKQKRQNFVNIIAKERHVIEGYEEILISTTAEVVGALEDLKSIKDDAVDLKSFAFGTVQFFKRQRQQLITERTQLLTTKNALQDKD